MLTILPVQQGQEHHCDNGKDTCALTMATMPLQRDDNTSLMTATTPLQQGQQCYHNDGTDTWTAKMCINNGNTIATRATMPAQQQQRCLRINDGDGPIVMRVTMPA
jgi:hypothetical protein